MRRIDWLGVTALLLFAAGLRIIGLSYGQPKSEYFPSYAPYGTVHEQLPVNPDSFQNVAVPVEMALKGRRNPEFFTYPSFIINVNYVMNGLTGALDGLSLSDRQGLTLLNYAPFSLYVFSRVYSVFGGLLMVACAYSVSRLVSGRYAAILAGLIVATSYTLVTHAHYAKPNTLATGWMMLALWSGVSALYTRQSGSRERLYILSGIATGLAASTYYNGIAVAIIVVPIGLVLYLRHRSRRIVGAIGAGMLAIPFFFFLTSPYILRDFGHFWHDFSNIVAQYKSQDFQSSYFTVSHWEGLSYLLTYAAAFSLGIPASLFVALSLATAWSRRPRRHLVQTNSPSLVIALVWLMVVIYALVVLRTIRPGHSEHQLIQILPFVALLSAMGADWLIKRLPLPPSLLVPGLALLLILQPLILSVQVVRMFSLPDTRQKMLDWIHVNIPPGMRFFVNGSYNVALDPAIFSIQQHFEGYAAALPSGDDFDFLLLSDAHAHDIRRSAAIVPIRVQQDLDAYLTLLDQKYFRLAFTQRPVWTGSDAMMNMAAYYHNPGLMLYCLNPASCLIADKRGIVAP